MCGRLPATSPLTPISRSCDRPPDFQQRPVLAVDRVFAGSLDFRDGGEGARVFFFGGAALVVGPGRRIGADHKEILASRKALVTCAGRQNSDIACLERERPTAWSPELHLRAAASNTENLMNARM